MVDDRFVKGLELFNREEFFESHEVIEGLWLETRGIHKDFYKGVIQAAAALHLLRKGTLSGAKGLLESSMTYLEPYQPAMMGLNVERLISDLSVCLELLKKSKPVSEIPIPKAEYAPTLFPPDSASNNS